MFGTYFPTFSLLSRSAFPSMCACRLFAARPPFAHSAVLSPTSCFVPAVENDENANMGSTGARNRSGARGSGKDRNDAA